MPARPARQRLLSGSCPSARSFAPRFLPTLGHPYAVALRFARCDQLTVGLAPTRVRPCWAHMKKAYTDNDIRLKYRNAPIKGQTACSRLGTTFFLLPLQLLLIFHPIAHPN